MSHPPIPSFLVLPPRLRRPDLLARLISSSRPQAPALAVRPQFPDRLLFSRRGIFVYPMQGSARRGLQRNAMRGFRHDGSRAWRVGERVLRSISLLILNGSQDHVFTVL
jgi:hypothetical protein